jgi:hypothetical protein
MTLSDLKRRSKAKPVESNLCPGVEIRWLRSQWRKPCQIVTRRLSLSFVACRAARQRRFSVNCVVMNDTTLIQG